jgi:hypothetical protein
MLNLPVLIMTARRYGRGGESVLEHRGRHDVVSRQGPFQLVLRRTEMAEDATVTAWNQARSSQRD